MGIWRLAGHREFFARRREAAEPESVGGDHTIELGALEPEPVPAAA
jgi:hypothetical protein